MQICGCAYEGLSEKDKFFTTVEDIRCSKCGTLQEHIGMVVFAGHVHASTMIADVLVWTKPYQCTYCGFTIRDVLSPCGEYILDFNHVLPIAN